MEEKDTNGSIFGLSWCAADLASKWKLVHDVEVEARCMVDGGRSIRARFKCLSTYYGVCNSALVSLRSAGMFSRFRWFRLACYCFFRMQKIAVFLVEWNESGFEYSSDQCDVLQSALRRLGHIYWYLNRPKARMYFDQAYAAIERGLSLAQEKKDTAPHTVALLILGKIDVVRKTRKRKEAQPILVNASDTLERLLPVIVRNQRVRVLRGLSETWLYLGSRSQARLFYEQADRIARTDNLRDQLLKLQGLRRRLDR